QRAHVQPHAALGVPVDAADVPLRRLDVSVGGDGGGRDARVPAQGRSGADLPRDSRASCDAPVRRDGKTMGEVMLRGNTIMKGYLANPRATAEAFREGWYHTGDLAVWHPDGYIEVKDRSKDIIISGGENISSLEVEECLYRHPQ